MAEQSTLQEAVAPAKEAPKFQAPKIKKKWPKRLLTLAVVVAIAVFILSRCMAGGSQAMAGSYLPAVAQIQDMTIAVPGPPWFGARS